MQDKQEYIQGRTYGGRSLNTYRWPYLFGSCYVEGQLICLPPIWASRAGSAIVVLVFGRPATCTTLYLVSSFHHWLITRNDRRPARKRIRNVPNEYLKKRPLSLCSVYIPRGVLRQLLQFIWDRCPMDKSYYGIMSTMILYTAPSLQERLLNDPLYPVVQGPSPHAIVFHRICMCMESHLRFKRQSLSLSGLSSRTACLYIQAWYTLQWKPYEISL